MGNLLSLLSLLAPVKSLFRSGLCSLCFLLFNLSALAAAPVQLHINTAVDTAAAAFHKTETNFTSLFQAVTSLTNTITFYGATNSPLDYSTTQLQLAIDSSKGAGVVVPKGRYLINATVDLPDNTRLIGDGMSSELVLTNVDVGLSAYGKTNIQIIGIKFSGKYSQAIAALFSTNVLVRECEFTDATRIPQTGWIAPIRSQSSYNVHIDSCRFYGNGNSLATFETSAEILIGGTADVTRAVLIENCNLVGKLTHYGIATLDMQDGRVQNNFIEQGNTIGVLNVGGYGIQSVGTMGATAQRNIFSGNTITNVAGSGIYLSNNIGSKVFDNHVANVTIQQTSASAQAGGIVLEASSLSDIARNVVTNSPVAGLVSTGPSNAILDNTLGNLGGTLSPTSLIGISLSGSDTLVDRNFIRGFGTGINNTGASNRIGILNLIHDNTAPLADAGGAVVKTLTAGATPSVRDAPSYLLSYAAPISITDFVDGLPGMDRTFFAANDNVTLVHSAGLLLNGAANLTLTTNQIIVLRRDAASAWHQVAGVGSGNGQTAGETNTASNLGTNGTLVQGLFTVKNGVDLPFRSLAAGTGITLSSNAATVVIASTAASGETNTASNLGTNGTLVQGLFTVKNGLDFPFRSLAAGSGITLSSNTATVTITSTAEAGGETNTASNLGTPSATIQGWYNSKSGADLRFRSIQAGTGITLSSNATTVTVSATAPGGSYSTVDEEGVPLTPRAEINFIGPALTAADNAGATRTDVTLSQSPASASVVGTGRVLTAGTGLTGGGDLSTDRTFSFKYTDTLAGNPTLNPNETIFGNNGILFEGSLSNTFEGFLTLVNPTADRTWTLPNASGTIPVSASSPISISALGDISITNIPLNRIAPMTPYTVLIADAGGSVTSAPLDSTQLTFTIGVLGITNGSTVTNFNITGNLSQNWADISGTDIDWTVADFRSKAVSGATAFTFSGLPTDNRVHFLQLILTNATGTASATFTNIDWRVPLGPFSMASITNGVQQVTFMYLGGSIFGDWTGGSATNATGLGDPVTPPHGGTGNDLSGALDGAIPFFDIASGKFITTYLAYTNALVYNRTTGLLYSFRTNATGQPLLNLHDGSGTDPTINYYADKIVVANTNLSLGAGAGFSVRTRINSVTGLELTENLSTVIGDGTTNSARTGIFLYIPTGAGPPTGVPVAERAGTVPQYYDTSGQQLYYYTGGAWVKLNSSNWTASGTTNSRLTGIAQANSIAITNGITALDIAALTLVRTDANKQLAAVTIGQNLTFDGTNLAATPSANWRANGTTNSDLSGIATVNGLVVTNALNLAGQTASRVLALDASKNVVTSFASSVLAATLTDETGTGLGVFQTAPVLISATNTLVTTFTDRRRLTGVISPTQITANKNDYNPTGFSTAAVVRINSDAARSISGLLAGLPGDEVLLFNSGSFSIELLSQNGSSDATNRFALMANTTLLPNAGLPLWYDGTSSRWKTLGPGGNLVASTINPTDGFLPYRTNGTTFADSPLQRVSATAIGLNSATNIISTDGVYLTYTNSSPSPGLKVFGSGGTAPAIVGLTPGALGVAAQLSGPTGVVFGWDTALAQFANTNFIPSVPINLGTLSFRWGDVFAANGYFHETVYSGVNTPALFNTADYSFASLHDTDLGDDNFNTMHIEARNTANSHGSYIDSYVKDDPTNPENSIYSASYTGGLSAAFTLRAGHLSGRSLFDFDVRGIAAWRLRPDVGATTTPYTWNTTVTHTGNDLLAIQNNATNKFTINHAGAIVIGSVTKAEKTALTPADGMLVYQTDNTPGFRGYVNGTWFILSTAADP